MSAPEDNAPRPGGRRGLVLLALLAALLALPFIVDVRGYLFAVTEALQAFGPVALVYVAGLYIIACVLMAPGSLLTVAAGFLAAALWPSQPIIALAAGYASVAVGSVCGATAAFLLGRSIARDMIARRIAGNKRFEAIDHAIGHGGFRIVLLLRLSPLFPFNLLNYGLGLTKVKLRDYVLASAIGMAPGTLLYVYLGTTAQSLSTAAAGGAQLGWPRTLLLIAGLVATFVVVGYVTRAAKRALDATSE